MTRQEIYKSILECIQIAEEEDILFEVLSNVMDFENDKMIKKIKERFECAIYERFK